MTNQQGAPEALRPEMLNDLIERFVIAGLGRHNLMRVELPRYQWAQLAVALSRLYAEKERPAALVAVQQPAPSAAAAGQQAGETDPHAELRKTYKPGQRWQFCMDEEGDWHDMHSNALGWHEPSWDENIAYRLHPDDTAPQPSPTPQADSQPAPVRDESAAPKLRAMAINYPEGACWDKLDAQTCMEGALEIEALRAARAPADSVTAPVGDAAMGPTRLELVQLADSVERCGAAWINANGGTQYNVGRSDGVRFAASELRKLLAPTPPSQAADSVLKDAAWMPLTPELLTAIESGDHGARFWLAAHNNSEPQIGVYEWRQGRNPHGFNSDVGRYGASEITHVMPYKPPALPAARKQGGA